MAIGGNKFLDGTLLASLPYDQGHTSSNSLGMNIGSVAIAIPPSIYLGGYH
jgi:hypothetical protein